MRLATSEAMLFKYGSGTGTDLSTIRSSREKLSGGGTPSGPLSFMRVYDQIAAVVKSGGKTRRAAKMQSLKDWHPDILEFIQAKAKEEKKARTLIDKRRIRRQLQRRGLQLDHVPERESLGSRVGRLHAGRRRRPEVDDALGHRSQDRWPRARRASTCCGRLPRGRGTAAIPACSTTRRSTAGTPARTRGRINASNPCSEYMFLDDTACNLSSLNLKKFQDADGRFNVERFRKAAAIFITAQEILVDHASYPTPAIAENSHRYRPLGLGYANLGSLLMSMGIPYDSDEGRGIAGALTALLERPGLSDVEPHRRPPRPVRRLQRERAAHAARDADASRRRRTKSIRLARAYLQRSGPRTCGTNASKAVAASATAMPRRRCWPRPARSLS